MMQKLFLVKMCCIHYPQCNTTSISGFLSPHFHLFFLKHESDPEIWSCSFLFLQQNDFTQLLQHQLVKRKPCKQTVVSNTSEYLFSWFQFDWKPLFSFILKGRSLPVLRMSAIFTQVDIKWMAGGRDLWRGSLADWQRVWRIRSRGPSDCPETLLLKYSTRHVLLMRNWIIDQEVSGNHCWHFPPNNWTKYLCINFSVVPHSYGYWCI